MYRTREEAKALLEQLQREFPYLKRDEIPPGVDLDTAPLLDHWSYSLDPPDGLIGVVTGHPHLRDGGWITTSQLVWIDETRGIARTVSRYYRLGRPLGVEPDQ
ncbi:DUF6634 family protein [Inquilinus sp. CAU 1745]|uniref:DUF6634 family protein n=1 Tax=Inquilinus sp. CAU 1745 TaxID=3140369 RepID=UPI00325BC677